MGLRIALADIQESKLNQVGREIAALAGKGNVLVVPTDVSKVEEVVRLRDTVYETWGEVRLRTQIKGPSILLSYSFSLLPPHSILDRGITLHE